MIDVLVIGAGASGLAAARELSGLKRSAVVLEARDRIGGRVWTDRTIGPVPIEFGAEFIHGAHVGTWELVRQTGAETLRFARWSGRQIALDDRRLVGAWMLELRPDLRRLRHLDEELAGYHGADMPLARWLAERAYSPLARHIADLRMAHAYCATPEALSVAALAAEYRANYSAGGDFKILTGYDRLIDALASGCDVRLATPVTRIAWGGDGVEAHTSAGATVRARRAIVTLPLAVLKAGSVRFEPDLPEAHNVAIERLAMRPAIKLIYRFTEPFWPRTMTFLSTSGPVAVWWTNRPGAPVLTGFLTGPRAERMSAAGSDDALERGLAQLEGYFGRRARHTLLAWQCVDWGADPWAMGGYSSTPPGAGGLRQVFAQPARALHFAGEATATGDSPATVHGAIATGIRAAREAASSLAS